MEGQHQRAGGRRRKRRKSKKARTKTPIEPVMIAARRPDSPFLGTTSRLTAASATPKREIREKLDEEPIEVPASAGSTTIRRRVARIVRASEDTDTQDNRAQRLLYRLERGQGRSAITIAANDLFELEIAIPRTQELQIQLLEHEDDHRARDAVFTIAELLQTEEPFQRPVLDQRLRRLEQSAEDPITRDAADALRRAIRANHGA